MMGDKLILEGDLEYGTFAWEDGFERIGGGDLLFQIAQFLGKPDIAERTHGDGCQRTVYRNVRITVERLDE